MEKKNLLKGQKLAEELGMKFDEASELFSEETLGTMKMVNIVGGTGAEANNCQGGYCVAGCGITTADKKCINKPKGSCPTEIEIDLTAKINVCDNGKDGVTKPPAGDTTPPPFIDSPIDTGTTTPPFWDYA